MIQKTSLTETKSNSGGGGSSGMSPELRGLKPTALLKSDQKNPSRFMTSEEQKDEHLRVNSNLTGAGVDRVGSPDSKSNASNSSVGSAIL